MLGTTILTENEKDSLARFIARNCELEDPGSDWLGLIEMTEEFVEFQLGKSGIDGDQIDMIVRSDVMWRLAEIDRAVQNFQFSYE